MHKTTINCYKYLEMDIQTVEKLPWDVDGDHYFELKCKKINGLTKAKVEDGSTCILVAERD